MSAATCNWPAFLSASVRSAPGFILRAFSSASAAIAYQSCRSGCPLRLLCIEMAHLLRNKIERRNLLRVGTVPDTDDGKCRCFAGWKAGCLPCHREPRVLDDLGPFGGFSADEGAKMLRRIADHRQPLTGEFF